MNKVCGLLSSLSLMLVLVLSSASLLEATTLRELVSENVLTEKAYEALMEARDNGYRLTVLAKKTPDKVKLTVLMGEKHLFNCSGTRQAGIDTIKAFPLRGREGYTPTSFASKAICCVMAPLTCCYDRLTRTSCGSLISYLDEIEDEPEKDLLAEEGETKPPKIVSLEDNHISDCAEDMAIGGFATGIIGSIALSVSCAFVPASVATGLVWAYTSFVSSFFCGGACGLLLDSCLPASYRTSWTRWLGMYGLVVGRNETMVTNIEKAHDENPNYTGILVIMGMAHLPGIKRLLIANEGYEEISLDDAPETIHHVPLQSEEEIL